LAFRTVFVVAFVALVLVQEHDTRQMLREVRSAEPLHGIWDVEEFEVDGQVRPPLLTDGTRWRRLIVDLPGMLSIQFVNDTRERYVHEVDWSTNTLTLIEYDDRQSQGKFTIRQPAPGLLELEGTMDGRTVRAVLRRTEVPQFHLVTRGFHWINEVPHNR